MYYELYIDIFFLENFMMDSILLLCIRGVFGRKAFETRAFAASAAGALLSCVVVVAGIPAGIKAVCFYLIIPMIMIRLGIQTSGFLQFVETLLFLYFAAICMAGIVQLFRPYIRIGSLIYVIAIVGGAICRSVWRMLTGHRQIQEQCCQVILYEDGKNWRIQALVDTGNMLCDSDGQNPVQIISKKLAEEIYGKKIVEELLKYSVSKENEQKWVEKKIHYISCQTIQGTHLLPVVTMEKMRIEQKNKTEIQKPRIGISMMEKLSEYQDYQMIVNVQSMGGNKYGCRDNEHTAVSDKYDI